MEFTASQIAGILQGEIEGDSNATVNNMAKIEEGKEGTITFLANPKYEEYIYTTKATIALVNKDFTPVKTLPQTLTLIRVENAYEALSTLLGFYDQMNNQKEGIEQPSYIHQTATLGNNCYVGAFAYIGENVKIEDNVKIYPHAYIGDNVTIGKNSQIYSGVKVYHNCIIGNFCTIHSGVIVGADGFGFAPNAKNNYKKVPQIGNVILEDYVEIGSNSTIDRATMGSTIIRKGVKLDNLIQVAHNVEIGENTVIAAQTGIAGSTKLGKNIMVGGQVGIGGHITIADDVKIAGQSGVGSNVVQKGKVLQGTPAIAMSENLRCSVLYRSLPKMRAQIIELENKLKNEE